MSKSPTLHKHVSDFLPTLRAAITEAREVGLNAECDRLESKVLACYTTSSEWLGECGIAIEEFKATTKGSLPRSTKLKLRSCLKEIGKVWPKFRPWLPWD